MLKRLTSLLQDRKNPGGALFSAALAAFLIQASGTVIKYLNQVFFARWAGTTEYGAYTLAFTLAQTLTLFAGLGLMTGALRFIPVYLTERNWGLLRGFITRSSQLTFLASVLISFIVYVALRLLPTDPALLPVLSLGLVTVPLFSLLRLFMEMTRATQHMVKAYLPFQVMQYVLLIVVAFIWLQLTGSLSAITLVWISVAVFAGLCALQWGLLSSVLPAEVSQSPRTYDTGVWLRVSLPLLIVASSAFLLNQADILMVGMFLGAKQAGIYSAATKTALLASFVLTAVNSAVAPMISTYHAKGDKAALQKLIYSATSWMFWPSLAAGVFLAALSPFIMSLFGADFAAGRWPLIILAFAQVINASIGPVGFLISLTGHQRYSAMVYGWSTLINIVLNAIMIPLFGLIGAAIATTLTMILWNVWLYRLVILKLGINTIAFLRITPKEF